MTDRRVHAEGGQLQVVRYERAGKWYLESTDDSIGRQPLTVKRAVIAAANLMRYDDGRVHLGLSGGAAFDRAYRNRVTR